MCIRDRLRYTDVGSLELVALAVRQQIVADRMDRPRHVPRYLKYLADFAKLYVNYC